MGKRMTKYFVGGPGDQKKLCFGRGDGPAKSISKSGKKRDFGHGLNFRI